MNCGLGNLDGVKRHLLAGTLAGDTKFDLVIQDIGLGVAAVMENFCNRKFIRAEGDQAIFMGDRASFILPRYPVEEVTAVELKLEDSGAWEAQELTFIRSTSPLSGLVYLPDNADGGPYWSQVRFTFTGGYYFETLEPSDDGYPSDVPAAGYPLPADLRMAWLTQVREVWNKFDKLGLSTGDIPDKQTVLEELDLVPMVKRTLQNYTLINPI